MKTKSTITSALPSLPAQGATLLGIRGVDSKDPAQTAARWEMIRSLAYHYSGCDHFKLSFYFFFSVGFRQQALEGYLNTLAGILQGGFDIVVFYYIPLITLIY